MKQTFIDQLTRTDSGHIEVRLKKLTGDLKANGTPEFRYHRVTIEPGGDVDAHMDAVNQHIATGADQVAFAQCTAEDRALVTAMQARIPQEVVDSFRAKRAEDEAQAETARVRAEQEMRSAP